MSVPSLYWGTCKLIKKLLRDRSQTKQSETFFRHLASDYGLKWIETELSKVKNLPRDLKEYVETVAKIRERLNTLNTLRLLSPEQQLRITTIFKENAESFDIVP